MWTQAHTNDKRYTRIMTMMSNQITAITNILNTYLNINYMNTTIKLHEGLIKCVIYFNDFHNINFIVSYFLNFLLEKYSNCNCHYQWKELFKN